MEQTAATASPAAPGIPGDVKEACHLILAAFAVSLIDWLDLVERIPPAHKSLLLALSVVLLSVFGGLTFWLIANIRRRRNWARWAVLVFLAAGWLLVMSDASVVWVRSPLVGIADVASIAMELVACAFLFSRGSRGWFVAAGGDKTVGPST